MWWSSGPVALGTWPCGGALRWDGRSKRMRNSGRARSWGAEEPSEKAPIRMYFSALSGAPPGDPTSSNLRLNLRKHKMAEDGSNRGSWG